MPHDATKLRLEPFKVACSSCNLRELCLPVGLSSDNLERLDGMVATRRTVARGDTLFCSGEAFEALYAVRTGFFKTCIVSDDGREQVTGFQMAGELLGLVTASRPSPSPGASSSTSSSWTRSSRSWTASPCAPASARSPAWTSPRSWSSA